ncbi:hypothetical protein DFH08DRAFT_718376, partial [Mycena albidolilacea]
IKECALRLWELGWDKSAIYSTLFVSQASLYQWAKIFEEFGSITPPSPLIKGRPRIIGLAALTAVKEIYTCHADMYLDKLQWWLAIHHNIVISTPALHETLEWAGLTRKLLHKIANEHDVACCYGCAPVGMPADFEDFFIRGVRYTLVAAMGMDGYIAQRVVEGSLDSFDFFDLIGEDVVNDLSVLVMDNCRIHHTDTLKC